MTDTDPLDTVRERTLWLNAALDEAGTGAIETGESS